MNRIIHISIALLLSLSFMAQAEEPRLITIQEFRNLEDNDTTTYRISGKVTFVRNTTYGNVYLSDNTAEVLIFGIRGLNDKEILLANGDSLTLEGRRYLYDRTVVEMKDAKLVSYVCSSCNRIPETHPLFKGKSSNEFSKWVTSRLRYPYMAKMKRIQGIVHLSFVVDTDGKVTDVTVVDGVDKDLDAEAVRVVGSSPKWTPGTQDGKPVRVQYNLPVIFSL